MSQEIMHLSNLPSFLMNELQRDYIVHDHANVKEPTVLQRVTALVGDESAKVDRNLLAMLPNVKLITIVGEHYDFVDVAAAQAKKILVSHTPGLSTQDTADLTFALMLNAARRIPQAERYLRNGDWVDEPFPLTKRVNSQKLGLIGTGALSRAIAQRARGFGMDIAYSGAAVDAQMPFTFYESVIDLAESVDFLVLTHSWLDQSHIVDAPVLRALGAKGYLINAAKAQWVDQAALIQALKDKQIAGAGLDVFWDEPRVSSELRTFSNVVLTPHLGCATHQARKEMSELALANLKAFFEGQALLTPVPECQQA